MDKQLLKDARKAGILYLYLHIKLSITNYWKVREELGFRMYLYLSNYQIINYQLLKGARRTGLEHQLSLLHCLHSVPVWWLISWCAEYKLYFSDKKVFSEASPWRYFVTGIWVMWTLTKCNWSLSTWEQVLLAWVFPQMERKQANSWSLSSSGTGAGVGNLAQTSQKMQLATLQLENKSTQPPRSSLWSHYIWVV